MVKDLWDPKLNTWNIQLVNYLFTPHADHAILQTAIVNVIGQDVLVWKLTSTDDCTFGGVQRPEFVSLHVVNLFSSRYGERNSCRQESKLLHVGFFSEHFRQVSVHANSPNISVKIVLDMVAA